MTALAGQLRTAPRLGDAGRADALVAELLDGADETLCSLVGPAGPVRDLVAGVADGSPYLWELCRSDPVRFAELLAGDPAESLDTAIVAAEAACAAAPDIDDAKQALRRLKSRAALLLALADLGGAWDVMTVTAALTRVADAAVSAALRWLLAEAARAGRLLPADAARPDLGCGVIVLAMGKHGAGELNYSSDVDLIVLYDPDRVPLRPGLDPGPVVVRLTQGLVRLLSERTPDGYVFRTDLRLRPDPGATQVAMSLPAAFSYYETVGQNWERAALIKARPCAGDLDAGWAFLRDIAPFIWRRHLDFAAIADVHAMKRQINAHKGHGTIAVGGHDLKLGRGGIREIEFFVQTQQLIAGGRDATLRGRQTLPMLAELAAAGWIDAAARDELSAAYRSLRGWEHRVQMVADEQSHTLPADGAALERFARFCGHADAASFGHVVTATLGTVQRHYARLFESSPALAASVGSLVFTGKADDPDTLESLVRLGFAAPHEVVERVRAWHFGRYRAMRSARAREDLTELTPALLAAFARGGRPDETLLAFDALLARMPSGFQLLSILRANPGLLDLLATILAAAPRLAALLAARPHALDGLLDPRATLATTQGEALGRLRDAVAGGGSLEERLDLARVVVRERTTIAGVRLLAGDLDAAGTGAVISAWAGAAVEFCLELVTEALVAAHGRPAGGAVAVLAMGKLGGEEMTATSDLDLILIYDHDPEAGETDGPRPIAPLTWFTRLTQRLIAALSAPTGQGLLFDVDMRLRPSGRQGPVAVHVDAFREYQLKEAWTWERMALTRARLIAGEPDLGRRVVAIAREALLRPRDPEATRGEVASMRALLSREKPAKSPWDVKLAPGGLIDAEFVAQGLQLIHAPGHPDCLAANTGTVLDRLRDAGVLAPGDHEVLRQAYDLNTLISQVARLCLGATPEADAGSEAFKGLLARLADAPQFATLAAELTDIQAAARAVFLKLVGDGAAAADSR